MCVCHQALLQLLVLNQEQERDQLLSLLRDVSLEDLQDPDCDFPVKEGKRISSLFSTCYFSHLWHLLGCFFLPQIVKRELL